MLTRDICAFGLRHWEAPHVAPAAACQAPGLEPHTDGKVLEGPLLPFPFFLFRSFSPSVLPSLNASVPPVLTALFLSAESKEERKVQVLNFSDNHKSDAV